MFSCQLERQLLAILADLAKMRGIASPITASSVDYYKKEDVNHALECAGFKRAGRKSFGGPLLHTQAIGVAIRRGYNHIDPPHGA